MSDFYELQVFRDRAWKVDSVFDDKELAIKAARRMEKSAPVRVIEERKDAATGRAVLRVVFRGGPGNASAQSGGFDRIENIDERVRTYVSDARRRRKGIGVGTVALNLLLVAMLVGAGFATVYFVHDYLNKVMP
jgi:hypothetical protein